MVVVGLLLWDRKQPASMRTSDVLLPGAENATTLRLLLDGQSYQLRRTASAWEMQEGDKWRIANQTAVEALLAELELSQVLGAAKIENRSIFATLELADVRLIVYGEAIDGRYVERCRANHCEAMVTRARLLDLLHPEGGWLPRRKGQVD